MQLGPTRRSFPGLWGYGRIDGLPVSADVSSPFGPRAPILTPAGWTGDVHTGVDLPAPGGTLIFAPCDFVVTAEGPAINGYGNAVFGQTADGYNLLFAHMQDGAHVGLGRAVSRGDFVGQVGTTGASTGTHLHFGVMQSTIAVSDVSMWIDSKFWVDPMGYFVEVLTNAEIVDEPVTSTPQTLLDFVSNSLLALAANPPADLGAALRELQRRVDYIKDLLA